LEVPLEWPVSVDGVLQPLLLLLCSFSGLSRMPLLSQRLY
jgi:hypothetical protein